MLTYQDLEQVNHEDTKALMAFVRQAINDHKASDLYKMAVIADEYDHKRNRTIMQYEKTLRTISGKEVPDLYSPNHKTTCGYFNYFVNQENQYLLANGATWQNEDTESKLGDDFDNKLQQIGRYALVHGISFGFYNVDHVEPFKVTEFKPFYDEETGALRAGIRFWQIDRTKPLRATLYEEDGYIGFIWGERNAEGIIEDGGRVYQEKSAYIIHYTGDAKDLRDGTEILEGENYPGFPIVPMWGNPLHQSELVGIQESIDAYDLIKNGFLNDLDTAQIYWILKGSGGMDDVDMALFLKRLQSLKVANLEEDQDAQAVQVNVPYAARDTLLNRIEADLYKDYGAMNVDDVKSGSVVTAQILAAYERLNQKADLYEYCVLDFINGILELAGIEDTPTFTRSKIVNVSDEIQTISAAATHLPDDYVTRKILTLLGDGDQADDLIDEMSNDDIERLNEDETDGRSPQGNGQNTSEAREENKDGVQDGE